MTVVQFYFEDKVLSTCLCPCVHGLAGGVEAIVMQFQGDVMVDSVIDKLMIAMSASDIIENKPKTCTE